MPNNIYKKKGETYAPQWKFLYKTASGENRLSSMVNFQYPVSEKYALSFTPTFVQKNCIRGFCFEDH